MNKDKRKAIECIVDTTIVSFAQGLYSRYSGELEDPRGVINMKRNNCFIAELGEEFMYYSAFVRSFDSAFGNVLENLGNQIAKLSFDVTEGIESFILEDQTHYIADILDTYKAKKKIPSVSDYGDKTWKYPRNADSLEIRYQSTDHHFYKASTNEHFLIELKASGNLDTKKAQSEKESLLREYYLLLNNLRNDSGAKVRIFLGTAYNMFGEGRFWHQHQVRQYFAEEELLIGRDYWNFVCDDKAGFDIIFEQYKKSAAKIREALANIKKMYFEEQ